MQQLLQKKEYLKLQLGKLEDLVILRKKFVKVHKDNVHAQDKHKHSCEFCGGNTNPRTLELELREH